VTLYTIYFVPKHCSKVKVWIAITLVGTVGAVEEPKYLGVDAETIDALDVSVADAEEHI